MSNGGKHSIEVIIRDGNGNRVFSVVPKRGNVRAGLEFTHRYITDHLGIYTASRNARVETKVNKLLGGKR